MTKKKRAAAPTPPSSDEMRIDYLDIESIVFADVNPKGHDEAGIDNSMTRFGYTMPPALNETTGKLIAGHGRITVLRARKAEGKPAPKRVRVDEQGRWLAPVIRGISFDSDDEALAYLMVDNKLTEAGGWASEVYKSVIVGLEQRGASLAGYGVQREEIDAIIAGIAGRNRPPPPSLKDRFGVPPFSVLDARQGYWQDRKRAWLAIGIRSEIGRGGNLIGRSIFDIAAANLSMHYGEIKSWIERLRADGKSDDDILEEIAARSGRHEAIPGGAGANSVYRGKGFPKVGAVVGTGKGNMVDALIKQRNDEKKRRGTNRAPMGASFGEDLMRGGGGIPADGLGPGTRTKARAFHGGESEASGAVFLQNDMRRPPRAASFHGGKSEMSRRIADTSQTASLKGGLTHGTTIHPYDGQEGGPASATGTSIFDPVLCELAYRWFCPKGGAVIDPFAGGSVRGIVAALLGLSYTGVDLRGEQIEANRQQAIEICRDQYAHPKWVEGDSKHLAKLAGGRFDLMFSCPPYADLEQYSDDPRDLSTMSYADFVAAYRVIIAAGVKLLKPDRFACFVVGDVRGEDGFYRRFISDTEQAFTDAGARLYNEAVLVTSVGSLPIRVGKQFTASRKLGKTHQNVLVFCKGDPKKATEACGDVEVAFPELDGAPAAGGAGPYGEELA